MDHNQAAEALKMIMIDMQHNLDSIKPIAGSPRMTDEQLRDRMDRLAKRLVGYAQHVWDVIGERPFR